MTLRKPTSPLSFLSYLHSQNRLLHFINRGSDTPTRQEYADYMSWAADQVCARGVNVAYSEEVVRIARDFTESKHDRGGVITVISRDVKTDTLITRRTSRFPQLVLHIQRS